MATRQAGARYAARRGQASAGASRLPHLQRNSRGGGALDRAHNVECTSQHAGAVHATPPATYLLLRAIPFLPGPPASRLAFDLAKRNAPLRATSLPARATPASRRRPFIHPSGNVEGRDRRTGDTDVIVCDGFIGNVALKVSEGLVEMVSRVCQGICSRPPSRARSVLCPASAAFKEFKKRVDYSEYEGRSASWASKAFASASPRATQRQRDQECHGRVAAQEFAAPGTSTSRSKRSWLTLRWPASLQRRRRTEMIQARWRYICFTGSSIGSRSCGRSTFEWMP